MIPRKFTKKGRKNQYADNLPQGKPASMDDDDDDGIEFEPAPDITAQQEENVCIACICTYKMQRMHIYMHADMHVLCALVCAS